jgi:hypothetical protein
MWSFSTKECLKPKLIYYQVLYCYSFEQGSFLRQYQDYDVVVAGSLKKSVVEIISCSKNC